VVVRALPRILAVVALAATALLAAACGSDAPAVGNITASLLVEDGAGGARWFRDLKVPDGTDGYELLEAAVEGELEATWSAEFQSHFVTGILGDSPEGSAFWGVFVWNDDRSAWEPLTVGADLFSVEQGRVMGWALIEYDPDNPQLPVSVP